MSSQAKLSIEEQLALYRTLRRKEEDSTSKKKKIWDYILWIMSFGSSRSGSDTSVADSGVSGSSESQNVLSDEGTQEENASSEMGLRRRPGPAKDSSSNISKTESQEVSQLSFIDAYTTLDWFMLGLKVLMWLFLVKIFILIEFGAVFFIFSAFSFIWYNMRSGPKKQGEISAYSVFNPNCEGIEGTFTAEQFERELLHKMY